MEIISKILSFLVAAPVIFLLVRYSLLRSRRARLLILFSHAVILTLLTLFLFNQPYWSWANQAGLIQSVSTTKAHQDAYNYIWNNFVLVDNSFDKELVLNPEGDEDDSTTITITSRSKLTAFFRLVQANIANVDLVVGDISFDMDRAEDSALQQELLKLSSENKLLLSIVPTRNNNQTVGLPHNVYGHVTEEGNQKLFVSHTIRQADYYSLSYKLYAHLNGLHAGEPFFFNTILKETDTATGETHKISNTFFPDFFISDEELLKGRLQKGGSSLSLTADEGYESEHHTFYYLSEALSPSGAAEFANNLAQRKKRGQKNIIFLGTFSSPTEDVHQTIYTDLHGPTILLNIFYALHLKRHYLTFAFILILFTGYCIISWVLIYRSLKLPFFSRRQKNFVQKHFKPVAKAHASTLSIWNKTITKLERFRPFKMVITTVDFLVEFVFVEELHLVLLVGLIFLVQKTTGHLINGMSLLIYLAVISALLRYAKTHISANR